VSLTLRPSLPEAIPAADVIIAKPVDEYNGIEPEFPKKIENFRNL
jgi:hypothetical protein